MAKRTVEKIELKVHRNTNYETLVRSIGNDEYNKRFMADLTKALRSYHSLQETAEIMRGLTEGVKVINKATFYYDYKIGRGDIGYEAWKDSEDDLLKFTAKVIGLMNIHKQRGEDEIDISSVLYYLAYFKGYERSNCRGSSENVKWKNKMAARSIASATIGSRFNPFVLRVMHARIVSDVGKALGLPNTALYRSCVDEFMNVYDEFYDRQLCRKDGKNITLTFPKIEYVIPVEYDIKRSQIIRLAHAGALMLKEVKDIVADIPSLSEESPELEIALTKIRQKGKIMDTKNSELMSILKKVAKDKKFLSYPEIKDHHRYFASSDFADSLRKYNRYATQDLFVEKDSFLNNLFKADFSIEIDCSSCDQLEQIESLVNSAAEILMVRIRRKHSGNIKNYNSEQAKFHILLRNVKLYSVKDVVAFKEVEKKVCSKFNQQFILKISYEEATARSRFGVSFPKYVRVISDIHADINRDRNYLYDFGDDLVLNCGDTGSNAYEERAWIRTFMSRGFVVAGNHLGYTSRVPELDSSENVLNAKSFVNFCNTREGQIDFLKRAFNTNDYTIYMSNDILEREGIIFIGTTLYTDFKLFGEDNQAACMIEAAQKMNDFRKCHYIGKNESRRWQVYPFNVERHLQLFKICRGYIVNRLKYLKKHKSRKPVVIITHHCPLPYCISDKYKNDPLSAAFASDMSDVIKEFPNIRLWCSGHVHDPYDFIFNETRFVCEPWGYFNENNFDELNYGKRIAIEDIKSNKRWRTLLKQDIKKGLIKDYGRCE